MATVNTSPRFFLAIDGVPFSTPAWRVSNLPDLFSMSNARTGTITFPGSHGAVGLPAFRDPIKWTAQVEILAGADHEGTPATDPLGSVIANLASFRTLVAEPQGSLSSDVRAISLTYPSPSGSPVTKTATCQVGALKTGAQTPTWWRVTLEITILEGRFA